MKEAVDRAVKEFGKLDIVVANAGIQAYGPLASTSERRLEQRDRHQRQGNG
jgi:NAD(P)-dependent dehydrogenase (short-subunit alcohol dehydrogenase family)